MLVAQFLVHVPTLKESFRIVRVQSYRLIQVSQRVLILLELNKAKGNIQMACGIVHQVVLIEGETLGELLNGPLVLAFLV